MFCSALGPRPETVRRRSLSAAASQLLQRRDAELLVDLACGLGPEPGQLREAHELAGELRAQLLGRGDVARLDQRADLLLERLADVAATRSRGPRSAAGRRRPGELRIDVAASPVGDDAVDDRPVELVEVGQLVQGGGDLGVLHRRTRSRERYSAMPEDWPPGPVWVVLPTYNERENLEPVVAGGPRGARPGRAGPHAC